jgi:DNA-binding beta-propeller fold protein YncE
MYGMSALLAPLLGLSPTAGAADTLYWSAEAGGTVRSANLDGTGAASTLFGAEASPCGLAIDPRTDKIYWADFHGGLRVGSLDGSGVAATLFDDGQTLCGVAIDPEANKIYWADYALDRIRVGNLDGTGAAATLFDTLAAPSGVAIDPAAGKIYWADQDADVVEVGNLDGTGAAAVLFGPSADDDNPLGVALDVDAGKIYWASLFSGTIRVGNLDGTGASTLFAGENGPGGLAIDPAAGKIYWDTFYGGDLRVGNLDGTGASTLFTGEVTPLFSVLLLAPTGTGPPEISGGAPLACSQGTWAPDLLGAFLYQSPRVFSYQWFRDGIDIDGATLATFDPVDAPGAYTCRVTAENQAGSSPQVSDPYLWPPSTTSTTSDTSSDADPQTLDNGASDTGARLPPSWFCAQGGPGGGVATIGAALAILCRRRVRGR